MNCAKHHVTGVEHLTWKCYILRFVTSMKWTENHCKPNVNAIKRLLRDRIQTVCVFHSRTLMPMLCHVFIQLCVKLRLRPRQTPRSCLTGRRVSRPAPRSPGPVSRRWTGCSRCGCVRSCVGRASDTGRACPSGPSDADAAAAARAGAAPPYSAWLYSPSDADAHLTETQRHGVRPYATNKRPASSENGYYRSTRTIHLFDIN